jgi:hypothetical protein
LMIGAKIWFARAASAARTRVFSHEQCNLANGGRHIGTCLYFLACVP